MTELEPITGNRYRHLDKGRTFRVVAVDEDFDWGESGESPDEDDLEEDD